MLWARFNMKIKKVEIQAFKSYQKKEDGTFDFTLPTSGDAANFSSIYAPNGFGKTSFFDAVDYAITGKISRFSRDITLRNRYERDAKSNNEEGKRQYLLRNKTVGAKDTDVQKRPLTKVEVYASGTRNLFSTNYELPRRRGCDYDFPRECLAGTKFFERMLLSQEAIDAFLRETTPEKRYDKFVEGVGDLSGVDDNRRSLLAVKNELEKKLQDLGQEIDKCEADLTAAKTCENPIDKANQLISEINQISEEPLSPFDAQHNQLLHDELLMQLVPLEEQSSDSMREFDQKKACAEKELNSLLETQRKVENLVLLKASESDIDQTIQIAKNIKQLESNKNVVQAGIVQISGQRKDVQHFLTQVTEFVEYQSGLRKLEKEQNELAETIKSAMDKKSAAKDELKLKRVSFGKAKEELEQLQTESETAKERFDKLSKLKTKRTGLKEQLAAAQPHQQQELINSVKWRLKQASALQISNPVQNDVLDQFKKCDREVLLEAQRLYQDIETNRTQATKQLDDTKNRLKETQGQAGEIRSLIELASSIVANSQQSACPVCQQDYKTVHLLQQRIADNPVLGVREKELTQSIQGLQSQICSYEEILNVHAQSFNKIVDGQKDILERFRENGERYQKNQSSLHEQAVKLLSQNAEQIKVLSEALLNKSEDEYQLFMGGEVTRSKQKNDELSAQITSMEKGQVILLSDNASLIAEKSKFRVRKYEQAMLGEPFRALQRYLEFLLISIDDSESALKEFLGKQESNWSDELEAKQLKRIELENQIAGLQERCAVEDRAASVDDLSAKSRGIVEQIGMLNQELSSFQALMKKMDRLIPMELLQWTCCKEDIERYINQQIDDTAKLLKAQVAMRSIQKISELAVEFRDPQMLQGQLNELSTQLKAYKLIIDALEEDIEKVSSYIRETTDAYLRTDLINQLYTAIDPHPEFKRVKFECNMEGGRPQLRIYAVDSEAVDQVCPTLTFSSAQINVLALSIFLAQALTTKDDNGENIDCIFIDDPVQSVDAINSLSFIDLMRSICLQFDKQIIVSTHDENFHELLKKKIPSGVLPAKYLKLASFGKVVDD